MTEQTPNHLTSEALRDQWAKMCALLIRKLGTTHVIITEAEIIALGDTGSNIAVHEDHEGLHLRIVDRVTADKLARENGETLN
jgi:hypothetical protein